MFVSYAQHGEDVILWRALGDRDAVTYVDVGAFDPTEDSVTRALYERGWRGVNLEAQADRLAAFRAARPDDVNLSLAIGDHDGEATLTLPGTPGWATIRGEEGDLGAGADAERVTVAMRTLATLLPELGLTHVDVLKIDVEGAEADVVRGLLAGAVRPTVVVVEGVSPGFGRAAGDEAVALLVAAGYTHCMFDGLNHYLTTDQELVEALSVPANPLDEFVSHHLVRLTEALERGSTGDDRPERRRETFLRLLAASGTGGSGPGAAGARQLDPAALERSTPATAIAALYRLLLGREPDTSGLAASTAAVAEGVSLLAVARGLVDSDEAQELPEGKRDEGRRLIRRWKAFHNLVELGSGAPRRRRTYTPGRVAAELFVGALYAVGLGRAPSASELQSEAEAVTQGPGREAVLRAFARRPDVRDRLRRKAPAAGAGRRLRGGGDRDLEDLRARVAEEEIARVAALGVVYAGGADRPAKER